MDIQRNSALKILSVLVLTITIACCCDNTIAYTEPPYRRVDLEIETIIDNHSDQPAQGMVFLNKEGSHVVDTISLDLVDEAETVRQTVQFKALESNKRFSY